jgi:acyl-CoA thioesterase-1
MTHLLIYLSLIISALLPVSAHADVTVLFLGDSLTSGYGISKDSAFPAVVKRTAASEGLEIKIINAGLSGDTSAGALRRIKLFNDQPVDLLFLAIGANDGLRGLNTQVMEQNIRSTIKAFKEAHPNAAVVLAGMKAPPNMGADYTTAFSAVYTRLSQEEKIALMPFLLADVAAEPKLNLPDRLHPNEEGHRIIGENVWKVIRDLVLNYNKAS